MSVYGVPDYKIAARIAGDGNVDLPLIGSTHVADLTVEQAQQLVAQKLIDGQMIISPDVLISVTDSNVDIIGVMGEVNATQGDSCLRTDEFVRCAFRRRRTEGGCQP